MRRPWQVDLLVTMASHDYTAAATFVLVEGFIRPRWQRWLRWLVPSWRNQRTLVSLR